MKIYKIYFIKKFNSCKNCVKKCNNVQQISKFKHKNIVNNYVKLLTEFVLI